ncbi:sigma-70 family RNA polymerase sigma factor [Roseateles sp. DAIF2]|uniref:sigma-70 family RNA polymerase sigma factor n=1 Tax=Roseateles sp. DAIF2 TaxID=2714952 RepID=UPI0018A33072|nr:sigma-70 family RNA polymerase sigma factor [Roseateles sp. DAIF2]QPF73256.1 sigma-70 family RNA polymerase sigma factor [Roseateles sp. DAIF2]
MSGSEASQQIHALYSGHHGWLLSWLRRRLGDAQQAADLAQDTFVRLLAAQRLEGIAEPRAYLSTVAKGLLINWYQRQALERAYLELLAQLPEPQVPSEEQRYAALQALQRLDALLDALPPLVRRCFLLSQIEGLGYEAIAKRCEISLSSVNRYMKQAFRQCLALMDSV